MAVTAKQPETSDQRPPASRLALWARTFGAALGRPIISVILAFIAGAIVILITWPNKTVDPFTNVINAYTTLFTGSFGTSENFSSTLVRVSPLIFASLSVAIAFRAGLFNIGAAGQLAVGAMAADMIGLTFTSWPSWILVPVMLLASILAGALWGGIVGFLKAWRGAHEVVTTIMLNWIAFSTELTTSLIALHSRLLSESLRPLVFLPRRNCLPSPPSPTRFLGQTSIPFHIQWMSASFLLLSP